MTETVEQRIRFLEQVLSSQPRSPLFAQLAAYYLDAGKTREALDLCDKGLSHYPFYSTAHLIKGKALLSLNMRAEARRELEFVQEHFPGVESIAQLVRDLPSGEIETLEAPPETPAKPTPVPEPVAPQAPVEPITAEANPDQWLSQFTEAAAAPAEPTPAVEAPPAEQIETFGAETPSEMLTETPAVSEDAFGVAPPEAPAAVEAPSTPSPFDIPLAPTETGEPFVEFAERKRGELFGLENTLSLEEYLGGSQQQAEPIQQEIETPLTEPEAVEPPAAEPPEDPFAALTQQFAEPTVEEPAMQPPVEAPTEDPFARLQQLTEEEPAGEPFAPIEQPTVEEPAVETPPEAAQDPFAQMPQPTVEEPPTEATVEEDAFAQLRQPPVEEPPVEEPPAAAPEEPLMQPEQPTMEEPSEAFTQPQPPAEEAPPAPTEAQERSPIEELADKLKNAKRITPIIDLSERAAVPPSEIETPSSTGFVTPTLAEIYAKQGWYDDAIKAYKILAITKPAESKKFEKRIQELEELKKQQQSG